MDSVTRAAFYAYQFTSFNHVLCAILQSSVYVYKSRGFIFYIEKVLLVGGWGRICIPTQIVSVWESYAPVYVDSCVEVQLCNMQLQFVNRYTAG